MKIQLLGMIALALFLFSNCRDERESGAATYLRQARKYAVENNYGDALKTIDSIKINYPGAYRSISAGELLSDSIVKIISRQKIDSLNLLLNDLYAIRISHADDPTAPIHALIDSLEQMKNAPRSTIQKIEAKETSRLQCTQCRTALQ